MPKQPVMLDYCDTLVGLSDGAFDITSGALATSGNSHRYLQRDGVRYSHILDARTGWSVSNALQSITVQASTCTEAGMFATFSCLKGAVAEEFLDAEDVTAWVQREPCVAPC